ncbi:MAG: S8 family serine peptidase, partial [Phycisphaerales bacterium]|nr:S8 family serine peptidase [Phycisphaerales bacterium]
SAPGFLYTDPGDIEADYSEAIALFGADLANVSLGTNVSGNGFPCSWEGDYNTTSILIDSIVRGSLGAPFRVIWANGNERGGFANCGAGYHTTAPPACAKNHIAVGAVDSDTDLISSFSSWGPTDDGRMKPDIAAPGCQVGGDGGVTSLSWVSDTAYATKCGTSMAAPTVTGICALILEDWRALHGMGPDPRNSTFKALLAHTAVDIEAVGPDYKSGYGSVRADAAIDHMRSGNLLEAEVEQSTSVLASVIVNPGDPELKVTLAWDDAPGTALATQVLVNDLDLVVHSPSGTRAYPWTLGGIADPGAAAVQVQENHVDNIEQVFVADPEPGAWVVEVRGTTVPVGPQPFSLTASPTLINCVDAGILAINGTQHSCSDTVHITVIDCGLNLDGSMADTAMVLVTSDDEPGGEMVLLTETGPDTATFTGSIGTSDSDTPGVLAVSDGSTITAIYDDADDGTGSSAAVMQSSVVDCGLPAITNVVIRDITRHEARIDFDTDEASSATIYYGTSCGDLVLTEFVADPATVHSILLTGLDVATDYFFMVAATDAVGNTSYYDDGGVCHTFTTAPIPAFLTEQFLSGSDLEGMSLTLTPSSSLDRYHGCTGPIAGFPTDPTGGTVLAVGDDSPVNVTLSASKTVTLFGTSYSNVWVSPNGYITLGASDTSRIETPATHFGLARVAAVFDDLNPAFAGTVSWKQLPDRAVFTWQGVAQFAMTDSNSFQIEMFFDGVIRISWVELDTPDFLAGISAGGGVDPDYVTTDLSALSDCGPYPPVAYGADRTVAAGYGASVALSAFDDGAPGPLSFTITSLPSQPLRDSGTHALITSVPYTLAGGGRRVTYQPGASFAGVDRFSFVADDGGTAPTGGPSPAATVTLTVGGALPLPFTDTFPESTFDSTKWPTVRNVVINALGIAEPSEPNSARLNGHPNGDDMFMSGLLDAKGYTGLVLSYWYEDTGGGHQTNAGDDLIVEYQDIHGVWHEVSRQLGIGPGMSAYVEASVPLPAAAAHAQLRIRFRSLGTPSTMFVFNDWFVDDVSVSGTPPCAGDADGDGLVNHGDLSMVIARFGEAVTPGEPGDLDGSGVVDFIDIQTVLKHFGCGPDQRP